MTIRGVALFLALVLARAANAASPTLPIYIEDSHAGSFYWLAEHLDLDEEYTLIHFDAHSDASAIFDSDKLRERLRRVASVEERRELLARWREKGAIQCFNWIEPLMPAPISRVIWVRGRNLTKTSERNLHEEAAAYFDGHLEAAPRVSGSFRERCRVVGFEKLRAEFKEDGPVVITIDLDYFAEVAAKERTAEFGRVWKFVSECRNLRAITFAISRPYLSGDEQAEALLRLALVASLSLPTATIQFEPFQIVGNDRSVRARELRAQKREVPAFNLRSVSEELRALLLANRERIAVRTNEAEWQRLLGDWGKEAPGVRLAVKDHDPSTDNVWRLPVTESAELELLTEPWDSAVQQVEWIALTPRYSRCNLTAKRGDEIGFGSGAPPRPRWRETKVTGRGGALQIAALRRFFDAKTGCGALRVRARVEIGGHIRETPVIELRRFAGTGFRAALTEQFGLPYLFGSGELRDGANTGPETGWGADCANFVVYALRRQGRQVPWSNPRQLKKYLQPARQRIGPGEAALTEEKVADGSIVHLGSHVAVVMEDRPPIGRLDGGDLMVHQLEGAPEFISLGRLLKARKTERFDLFELPPESHLADLIVGGDVMLGRTVGDRIRTGADPLEGIRPVLQSAPWKIVNLECVVSDKGTASAEKAYSLRAPDEALRILTEAGISAVGLANNHAADFGQEALIDSIARLQAAGIATVGAGETLEGAYAPQFFTTRDGEKVAVIALTDVENANDRTVAKAAERDRVSRAIAEARASATFILCLVHWGDENTPKVNEAQRELARWLIDQQVDLVVGAHSHCLQPLDFYHGRPVVYSLGNLVFDGAPTLRNWNKGELLAVDIGRRGIRVPSLRLIPVRLDARGFPQSAPEIAERVPASGPNETYFFR